MIVYNSASGTTSGNTLTTQTTITPGFQYFYNPNGAINGNITSGVWRPMTAAAVNPKVDVKTTETVTNTLTDTKQVYAIKGAFTADGLRTDVDILSPAGMTSLMELLSTKREQKKFVKEIFMSIISLKLLQRQQKMQSLVLLGFLQCILQAIMSMFQNI